MPTIRPFTPDEIARRRKVIDRDAKVGPLIGEMHEFACWLSTVDARDRALAEKGDAYERLLRFTQDLIGPGTILGNNYSRHGRFSGVGKEGEPWYTTDGGTAWSAYDVRFRPDKEEEIARLTRDLEAARAALSHASMFINYARYELQPGKAVIGDQFPKQDDATAEIAAIAAALAPSEKGETG